MPLWSLCISLRTRDQTLTTHGNVFSAISVYMLEGHAAAFNKRVEPLQLNQPKRRILVKKYSSIVAVLISVAGLLVPARAQETKLIVTVPFDFIVGTHSLPAGEYTVSRTSSLANTPLLVSNRDHGAFLLPTVFDSTESKDASLSFDQIGEDHVLSQIRTPTGTYTIDNRREVERLIKLAQSNDHNGKNGMTSSGAQ